MATPSAATRSCHLLRWGPAPTFAAASTGALFWGGSETGWQPVADTVEAAYLSGLRAAREASAWLRSTSGL